MRSIKYSLHTPTLTSMILFMAIFVNTVNEWLPENIFPSCVYFHVMLIPELWNLDWKLLSEIKMAHVGVSFWSVSLHSSSFKPPQRSPHWQPKISHLYQQLSNCLLVILRLQRKSVFKAPTTAALLLIILYWSYWLQATLLCTFLVWTVQWEHWTDWTELHHLVLSEPLCAGA